VGQLAVVSRLRNALAGPDQGTALVVWRQWIDDAGRDPREELAFQVQLSDYGLALRQEGGGVTRAWKPGAAPDEWRY